METSIKKPLSKKDTPIFKSLEEFVRILNEDGIKIHIDTPIVPYLNRSPFVKYLVLVTAYKKNKKIAEYESELIQHDKRASAFSPDNIVKETIQDIEEITYALRFKNQSLFDYQFKYQ